MGSKCSKCHVGLWCEAHETETKTKKKIYKQPLTAWLDGHKWTVLPLPDLIARAVARQQMEVGESLSEAMARLFVRFPCEIACAAQFPSAGKHTAMSARRLSVPRHFSKRFQVLDLGAFA